MRRNAHILAWSVALAAAAVLTSCKSAWVSSGLLYRDQNHHAKAEEMFKRALWYNDNEAMAHYELANTLAYRAEHEHMERGEVDSARIKVAEAFQHYRRAAELDPGTYENNPDAEDEADRHLSETGIAAMYAAFYNQAVRFMNNGDNEDAMTYLGLAALADPRGARGFEPALLMAKLRYNEDQGDEANARAVLADLDKLHVDPSWEGAADKEADLVQTKAQIHRALGEEDIAANLYSDLLESRPNDVHLMQSIAQIRRDQGEQEAAGDLFSRAFDVANNDPEYTAEQRFGLAFQAAVAYREAEAYEKSITASDEALRYATTNKERASLTVTKARAYYELDQFDLALSTVEPVVRDGGLDPNSVPGWQIYYQSLNKVGRTDEAIAARERFQALQGSGR